MFGNQRKLFVLFAVAVGVSSLAPQLVRAQDDSTDDSVTLSREKPIAAPVPENQPATLAPPEVPSMGSTQPSYPSAPQYENDDSNRPFRYPQYSPYNSYTPQEQYGQPYTRPGYYPSGSPDYEPTSNFPQYGGSQQTPYYRGGITVVPQGLVIPIDLRTAISTQVAKAGDFIEATVNQNIPLNGSGYLPAGSVISGQVTEAKAGRRLSRSGSLSIAFNNLRLPSGASFPMTAHLVGSIGRYKDVNGVERGEGWKAKLGQLALRGVGGAGLGAALGTGLGAIVNGGSGAGTGAWAGAAFGGGLGAMDMLLRKGRDVIIPSGTEMKLQMDQPLNLPLPGGS
ncbi:MAG: hypothetical protein U0103_00840 [Candidatus Obscuribacterales bacterium]|nr:hypothetical protein [Cyanobacteria bacterium SZAS LIN-5]